MIHLYDAMCVVRRELETDPLGRAPRKILSNMLASTDVSIWCWDAPYSRAKRREIFPAYKTTRKPHPDDIWPLIDLIKEGLRSTRAIQVECKGFEADDIIATICRKYPGVKKHIHSTDRDLGQLLDADTTADFKVSIPPEWIRLYKCCVGDPSDDIPGIKGFGKKTWASLQPSTMQMLKATLERWIAPSREQYPTLDWKAIEVLPTRCRVWIEENRDALKAMWEIVGLLTVPDAEIEAGTVAGVADLAAVEALLRRFKH